VVLILQPYTHLHLARSSALCPSRINKKNSQKDVEQKKNGNYFFYDDGADDEEDEDFDDI
jgi:hypothetical protein